MTPISIYRRIQSIVCCPSCYSTLVYRSEEISRWGTKKGKVYCPECQKTVAAINDYKLDFIRVTQDDDLQVSKDIFVDDEIVREDKVQGNQFPTRFQELIDLVDEDGLILDFGGGPRQMTDPRYINFEYSRYDEVDIFGDGHKMPFKDNSFDLILSQAVTEHVYNPFKNAEELFRVMKPGGKIYVESAFMQPLHGVPYHYFNTTLWGIEELFKDFQKVNSGWFGNFSDLIGWMLQSTGIEAKVGKEKIDTVMGLFKEFDQVASYEDMKPIAIGVYIEGIKSQ